MTDWQQFKMLFQQQFVAHLSVTQKLILANQLNNRRQGLSESVTDYYHDVMKMCRQYDPHMQDDEQRTKLLNGLRTELLDKILVQPLTGTTNDLLLALQQVEAGLKFTFQRMNDSSATVDETFTPTARRIQPSSQPQLAYNERRPHFHKDYRSSTAYSANGNEQRQSNWQGVCYQCGRFGHYAQQCPNHLN
ncbi:unnamed protein product [Didymodactylos carnosus]|uniref:CCHC-type domain-containing protein n=1 Tax=Didymodactylos carnosus TaxID=1234261 RepID=A0A8S2XJQ8_9BILA|nr:unnamed protein product [Didymodactylos carnosus]